MELDSPYSGDTWVFNDMATSLLFSAASPPLPPWPCGDSKQHPSTPPDTAAHLDADVTGEPAGNSVTTEEGKFFNGKCEVHLSLVESCSNSSFFVKQRLTVALRYLKDSTNQDLLVQVWAPIKNGDRYMLSTSGQPFVLDQRSIGLLQYRAVSMMYNFSIDGDSIQDLGLPGRVFKQRVPEWTPNVQHYSSKEYARLNHATNFNVHGTVALPIFDPPLRSCIAVVELITTSKKVNYTSVVDKVCKALEAVNLTSTDFVEHPCVLICNEHHQAALVEMLKTLTVTCEELKLPLAQTWVPCKYPNLMTQCQGVRRRFRSCFQESCMSTSEVAFHVTDAHMWGFRNACVKQHLQKGQGVSGKAFLLRRPCFARDATKFSQMEYPLVNYARMFGLVGCFSVCVQSAYTGNDDYTLEFFLPPDCRNDDEQKLLVESILALLRQNLHSLHVATYDGSSEACLQIDAVTVIDYEESKNAHAECVNFTSAIQASHGSDKHRNQESNSRKVKSSTEYRGDLLPDNKSKFNGKLFSGKSDCISDSSLVDINNKHQGRRRRKAEYSIGLDVIQQYFSGSLKSAAKSLGVCPTTMKRICRQHGISRWPSRQISKVNRSISNLKKVIATVEGPEGSFNLASITCPVPVSYHQFNSPNIENGRQNKVTEISIPSAQQNKGSSSRDDKPLENDVCPGRLQSQQRFLADISSQIDVDKASDVRNSYVHRSAHSGTSEEYYHGSPVNKTDILTPPDLQQRMSRSDDLIEHPSQGQHVLPRLFIKDSECSQDFKNHAISTFTQPTVAPSGNLMLVQNSEIITVKARYKEDILRFRFPRSGSIITLKDEVAKRVQMDVGVFDIKYLDDENDWVKLTCDADLAECMEISQLSGSNVLRLLVTEIAVIVGSSCGSTG